MADNNSNGQQDVKAESKGKSSLHSSFITTKVSCYCNLVKDYRGKRPCWLISRTVMTKGKDEDFKFEFYMFKDRKN